MSGDYAAYMMDPVSNMKPFKFRQVDFLYCSRLVLRRGRFSASWASLPEP